MITLKILSAESNIQFNHRKFLLSSYPPPTPGPPPPPCVWIILLGFSVVVSLFFIFFFGNDTLDNVVWQLRVLPSYPGDLLLFAYLFGDYFSQFSHCYQLSTHIPSMKPLMLLLREHNLGYCYSHSGTTRIFVGLSSSPSLTTTRPNTW